MAHLPYPTLEESRHALHQAWLLESLQTTEGTWHLILNWTGKWKQSLEKVISGRSRWVDLRHLEREGGIHRLNAAEYKSQIEQLQFVRPYCIRSKQSQLSSEECSTARNESTLEAMPTEDAEGMNAEIAKDKHKWNK